MKQKLLASLSLDLDNKWSYMKTHGDAGWEDFPSYLETVVPRVLNFLSERKLKITFFIVGQDAALEKNHAALKQIAEAGHEIGNHSFRHEPWLHLYSKEEFEEELSRAEDAIFSATGKRTKGFRGPGYSLSPMVLRVLTERGYEYDCSSLPTHIGPLARLYYFFTAPKMSEEETEKRKMLFGKFSDGFQPLRPYQWRVDEKSLTEIPVTTLPVFKTPIHFSYILYLSSFSKIAARAYWNLATAMCRMANVQPSLLLHPLDFLSADDAPELKFFPAMNLALDEKLKIVSDIIEDYCEKFQVVDLQSHAADVNAKTVTMREMPSQT